MTFVFKVFNQDLPDTWGAIVALCEQLRSHGYEESAVESTFHTGSATWEIVLTAAKRRTTP